MASESYIQKKCQDIAKKELPNVVILRTYTEGYPDRQFIWKGKSFFIEFKATGKKARPLQIDAMRNLMENGFDCFIIDDVLDFKKVLDIYSSNRWPKELDFYKRCLPDDKMSDAFAL